MGGSRPPERPRASTDGATRPTDRLAIASALVGGVLVAALLVVHFLTAGPVEPSGVVLGTSVAVPPARVQVGASPESARSTASPSAPQATAQSNTTSLPGGERLRVTGTDGP